jgi:hypothetical protein
VDLRPAVRPVVALAVQRQELTDWSAVLKVLVDHRPVQYWWWSKCTVCWVRWPCPVRELALDELTGGAR